MFYTTKALVGNRTGSSAITFSAASNGIFSVSSYAGSGFTVDFEVEIKSQKSNSLSPTSSINLSVSVFNAVSFGSSDNTIASSNRSSNPPGDRAGPIL